MSSGRNFLFPRSGVPANIGDVVKKERRRRGWSQERLARRAGVERRTIMRLEEGRHVPGSELIHAIEEALKLGMPLVPTWSDHAGVEARGAWGPRARLARKWCGQTLDQVAKTSGVSAATISRFEREMGDTPLIIEDERSGTICNKAYAEALCFAGTDEMSDYLKSAEPRRWLSKRVVELVAPASTQDT